MSDKRVDKILVICTGNICRSPICAAMLQNCSGIVLLGQKVESAGIRGLDGQNAHPLAQQVMKFRGVDISEHRARTVTPDIIQRSSLVLAMENVHLRWLVERMPTIRDRVYLLGHWENTEIMDPLGSGLSEFEDTANTIERCLEGWIEYLSEKGKSASFDRDYGIT